MTERRGFWWGVLLLCLCGVAQAFSQANSNVPAKGKDVVTADITVTLLGSGGGPNPNPRRFGPSILVQAAAKRCSSIAVAAAAYVSHSSGSHWGRCETSS